jgi:hypothetical protein
MVTSALRSRHVRRHLGADEAGSDDDHPGRPGVEGVAHGEGIVDGAQRVDTGQALGPGEVPRRGSAGDDQTVERQRTAVGEGDGPLLEVEAGGRDPQLPGQVQLLVAAPGEGDLVRVPLASKHLLRQRRPVVGGVDLGAHDRDGAPEPLAPEGLCGSQARQRGADDHDAVERGHGCDPRDAAGAARTRAAPGLSPRW